MIWRRCVCPQQSVTLDFSSHNNAQQILRRCNNIWLLCLFRSRIHRFEIGLQDSRALPDQFLHNHNRCRRVSLNFGVDLLKCCLLWGVTSRWKSAIVSYLRADVASPMSMTWLTTGRGCMWRLKIQFTSFTVYLKVKRTYRWDLPEGW